MGGGAVMEEVEFMVHRVVAGEGYCIIFHSGRCGLGVACMEVLVIGLVCVSVVVALVGGL